MLVIWHKAGDGDLHEKANGTSVIFRRVVENLEKGPSGRADDVVDISRDKEQDDQKDSSSKGANADTGNHDFGAFDRSVGDFCPVINTCRSPETNVDSPSIMCATAS